jgi:integrase/recombinase XerC
MKYRRHAPGTEQADGVEASRPEWFAAFLADRGTRKPSAHTIKAYRQDFDAIATLIAGNGDLSGMPVSAITVETMRTAFSQYAETHEAASIQRCWSTWNVLCTYLYTSDLIAANPMPMVGRPKLAKMLPKALQPDSVAALLAALSADPQPRRRSDWMQRDRALVLIALLAGLRADELVRANVGDLRRTDGGAVIHVRGKGGKDRRIPIEPALVQVLERYLDTRAARFPATAKRRSSPGGGLAAWPAHHPRHPAIPGAARVSPRRH